MEPKMLWHVHDKAGDCYALAINYDVAIQLCISFYDSRGKTEYFFATQEKYAKLSKRPLPNS